MERGKKKGKAGKSGQEAGERKCGSRSEMAKQPPGSISFKLFNEQMDLVDG